MKSKDLNTLEKVINEIHTEPLNRFVVNLLSNKEVLEKFLIVPASYNHHHFEQGGLLSHSLEVAEIIGLNTFENQAQRELAMIAGLLHDIGKVMTHDTKGNMTSTGLQVAHEPLALEICANALKQLDQEWHAAANFLRHVWTCSSFNSKVGYQPNSSLALIVKQADQLSVKRYMEKKAFKGAKQIGGMYFHEKHRFQKIGRRPIFF